MRFNEEVLYLKTMFPVHDNVCSKKGVIIRLKVGFGFDNYNKEIGDPMQEETLIVGEDDNSVALIFQASENKIRKNLIDGVTAIKNLNYTKGCVIHKMCNPLPVPYYLKNYVFEPTSYDEPMFFNKNYRRGGMISLKEVKTHHEWKKEYERLIEIKDVNMCKGGHRAYKTRYNNNACCSEYSQSYRVKKKMVIGWQKLL